MVGAPALRDADLAGGGNRGRYTKEATTSALRYERRRTVGDYPRRVILYRTASADHKRAGSI